MFLINYQKIVKAPNANKNTKMTLHIFQLDKNTHINSKNDFFKQIFLFF
jgi:hypothetical protein